MAGRRSSWVFDSVVAVITAAVVLFGSIAEANAKVHPAPPRPGIAGYLLVVIASLVLVGRRRAPVVCWAISITAVLIYTGLGYVDGASLVAVMIALYTVVVTGDRRRSLIIGAITVVALMTVNMAFEPFGVTGGPVVVIPFLVASTFFLGLAVASRRAYVAGVEERAVLAERNREEEARRRVGDERLRIARELHDVVAHSIAMINVQAGVAAHVIDDRPEQAKDALVAIKGASKEALRELRGLLEVLRQVDEAESIEPAPGLGQLDVLVTTTSHAGLATTVSTVGDPRPLPPLVDLAAYRIVQESLTNALRYAGPATTEVSFNYGSDRLIIQIDDNGRGVTPDSSTGNSSGHGITGMRERAAAVGGTLEAGPRHGGGFRVRASLPVDGVPS